MLIDQGRYVSSRMISVNCIHSVSGALSTELKPIVWSVCTDTDMLIVISANCTKDTNAFLMAPIIGINHRRCNSHSHFGAISS